MMVGMIISMMFYVKNVLELALLVLLVHLVNLVWLILIDKLLLIYAFVRIGFLMMV
jgi:hypothetical protein